MSAGTEVDMEAQTLIENLHGELLRPGDDGFDSARRVWSSRADGTPDVIVRCLDDHDVREAVGFARDSDAVLSVKNGGHSYGMNSVLDSGVLLDMSLMDSIEIDESGRTVKVGGGVTTGQLELATRPLGLAVPLPAAPSIGVAGAALGGGNGLYSRIFGLTTDNIISADVVTSDSSLVRANEEDNPDLLWALRGGGGNFGVVTSLTLRLHEVERQLSTGIVVYPFDGADQVLRFYREFMEEAPDDFYCGPVFFRVPARDPYPEEAHEDLVVSLQMTHANPDASDFFQPLLDLGDPIARSVTTMRYESLQEGSRMSFPHGHRYYSKAHDLDELSDGAINTVLEYAPLMEGEFTQVYFSPNGGAIATVDDTATAFGSRRAPYSFHCIAGWNDPERDEEVMSWASQLHADMAPHANGGVYVLQIADDENHRIPAAYGANYKRLQELKQVWDPENLFQSNYNIPPDSN